MNKNQPKLINKNPGVMNGYTTRVNVYLLLSLHRWFYLHPSRVFSNLYFFPEYNFGFWQAFFFNIIIIIIVVVLNNSSILNVKYANGRLWQIIFLNVFLAHQSMLQKDLNMKAG